MPPQKRNKPLRTVAIYLVDYKEIRGICDESGLAMCKALARAIRLLREDLEDIGLIKKVDKT